MNPFKSTWFTASFITIAMIFFLFYGATSQQDKHFYDKVEFNEKLNVKIAKLNHLYYILDKYGRRLTLGYSKFFKENGKLYGKNASMKKQEIDFDQMAVTYYHPKIKYPIQTTRGVSYIIDKNGNYLTDGYERFRVDDGRIYGEIHQFYAYVGWVKNGIFIPAKQQELRFFSEAPSARLPILKK